MSINSDGYLTNSSIFINAVVDFVETPGYQFYNQHIIFEYAGMCVYVCV